MLALLHDSGVIARAVAQYCPALLDADLLAFIHEAEPALLHAVALRERLSARVVEALLDRRDREVALILLRRSDVALPAARLLRLAEEFGRGDVEFRGALLARHDLPGAARLLLVEAVADALRGLRLVKGAVQPKRLDRLMRNATDTALTSIGERTASEAKDGYAALLIEAERISTRVMLHAIVNGHVMFFADCMARLSELSRDKVFTILETGSRATLNALFARSGMKAGVRNLLARLVMHARSADLADDVAARHFVVTALTEELIVEHDGQIPAELEEAFNYLSEQNVMLARLAARGVMSTFAGTAETDRTLPVISPDDRIPLPAA
jgi:uncharacterized protein (DUF2336 family)